MNRSRCRVLWVMAMTLGFMGSLAWPLNGLDPQKAISQYIHKKWNTENGLPQQVYSIAQSSDGYMWLGTAEGLFSFDGIHFSPFELPVQKNQPEGYPIVNILTKPDNLLYFVAPGIGSFRIKGKSIEPVGVSQGTPAIYPYNLVLEPDETLWIGTIGSGLHRWQKGKHQVFDKSDGLADNDINTLTLDGENILWIGTHLGLSRMQNGICRSFGKRDGLVGTNIICIYADSKGRLWVGTDKGLHLREGERFTFWPGNSRLTGPHIMAIIEDKDNNLWVGTRNGLNRIQRNRVDFFTDQEGLSNNYIHSLFLDVEGNLWVGTGGGLDLLREGKLTVFSKREGLSADYITCVYEDTQRTMWIGNGARGISLLHQGKIIGSIAVPKIPSNNVSAILQDRHQRMWIGTWGSGISIRQGTRRTLLNTSSGLSSDFINAIYEDREGTIWVGTEGGGLNRVRGDKIEIFDKSNGLCGNCVLCIHQDRRGDLWIATDDGGISRYQNNRFLNYTQENGLPSTFITSICEDSDGTLWFGTRANGLLCFQNNAFTSFTKKSGLFHQGILSILEDHRKNLWLSTPRGIFSVKRSDLAQYAAGKIGSVSSTNYGRSEGMRNIQCTFHSQNSSCKSRDGRLWFPTMEGVIAIDPFNTLARSGPPPVKIERFMADGRSYSIENKVNLPAGRRNFEFHFTTLQLSAPEKTVFKYRLSGFDQNWIETRDRRIAFYTAIPPGDHTFQVIACNSEGIWNATGASFSFRLQRYFYQTGWFFLLVGLLLITGSFTFYAARVASLKRKQLRLARLVRQGTRELQEEKDKLQKANEELKKANASRNEFLGFVAHDLKNTLQSIVGFAELIQGQAERGSSLGERSHKILQAAERMLNLIEDLLHSSMIENGQVEVHRKPLGLTGLLEKIVQGYQAHAQQKNQSLILSATPGQSISADELMIRRVYENLVNNAIKFAPNSSRIWITLEDIGTSIRFSVRDEGPGLTEDDKRRIFGRFQRLSATPTGGESSTGLGLFIVKQLVELHDGRIWVESEVAAGSKFFVDLPKIDS